MIGQHKRHQTQCIWKFSCVIRIFFFHWKGDVALELIAGESAASPTSEITRCWLDEGLNKCDLSRPYSEQVVFPNNLWRSLPAWDSGSDPTTGNRRTLDIMLEDGAAWVSDSLLGWSHSWIQCISWQNVKFCGEPDSYKLSESARQKIICWLISLINAGIYPIQHCQMNPLNFSWSFTPGQRAWFLWKGKDIFGPNFQSLQFPIWNLICREKESSKWQWDGSKQMLWAMPCSWGMLWGQRCLLVLHHNGNALHCSGKLTNRYLHQYFLLKSKIQGAALIFLLIFMGTWPALPIIHTMVWLGLWYVTQHFKTETDNF